MAKSKHSRALFEVIKQAQQRQQKRRDIKPAAAGSWWPFGKRDGGGAVQRAAEPVMRSAGDEDAPVPDETPQEEATEQRAIPSTPFADDEQDSTMSAREAGLTEGAPENSEPPVAQTTGSTDAGQQSDAEPPTGQASDDEPLPVATTSRPSERRRGLQFSLSFPTVAIAGVAVLVLLITAFLAGKHFARPAGSIGPSLVQIKNGKTFPEVLNVNPGQTKATLASTDSKSPDNPPAAPPTRKNAVPAENNGATPTADQQRVIGRNYIIVQSYPDSELAGKAADLLAKNDIPVSVEQLDFAPGWYCVVTRVGFDRPSAPEYQRYEKLIRDANAQAAAARIKKFDPYPYKWK